MKNDHKAPFKTSRSAKVSRLNLLCIPAVRQKLRQMGKSAAQKSGLLAKWHGVVMVMVMETNQNYKSKAAIE